MNALIAFMFFATVSGRMIVDNCDDMTKMCIDWVDMDGKIYGCTDGLYECLKKTKRYDVVVKCIDNKKCSDKIKPTPKPSPSPKPFVSCPDKIDPLWKEHSVDRLKIVKTVKESGDIHCDEPFFDDVCKVKCIFWGFGNDVGDMFTATMLIGSDDVYLFKIEDHAGHDVCPSVKNC